jgi:hypothetical protein
MRIKQESHFKNSGVIDPGVFKLRYRLIVQWSVEIIRDIQLSLEQTQLSTGRHALQWDKSRHRFAGLGNDYFFPSRSLLEESG